MSETTRVEITGTEPTDQSGHLPSNQNTPPSEGGDKLYAGKYKSVEELEKGYTELVKKLGQPKPQEPKQGEAESKPKPSQNPLEISQSEAEKAVQSAGLNWDALGKEFSEKGTLSDESFAALEKAGIPRTFVDTYLEGIAALTERNTLKVMEVVGGEENYSAMVEWARANLSKEEVEAYNTAVTTGNSLESVKLAVQGLYARYSAVNGSNPNLIKGDGTGGTGAVYESWAQVTKDMADPRYQKDPAYRNAVQSKLARSKNLK